MQFSQQNLFALTEQTLTITELLGDGFVLNESQESDSIVNSQIEQWCQVVDRGNWKQFKKRLAWDNLDLNTIRHVLGSVHLTNEYQLPSWTEILNETLRAADPVNLKTLEKSTPGEHRFLDSQVPLPFEEALLPFIYVAIKKLNTLSGSLYNLFSEDALASLERSLLRWLSYLCSPSLELEFSIFRASRQSTISRFLKKSTDDYSKKHYQEFINSLLTGELLTFFQEYPVLARLMAMATDMWINATQEFISRLEADWSEIQKTFQNENELGQVATIRPELSDRHHNGRSVMAVTFVSGLKLIYKPKNLGLEEAYVELLGWFNEHGVPLKFQTFKVLNRSTYGWVEFVPALPCKDQEEAKRYYQRTGMLLCLVHVLEGTDLHNENVIACGEHPVLIDLETLMHPRVKEVQDSEANRGSKSLAYQQLWHSVLRTGLLPQWQIGAGGQAYDVSALGAASQQETFVQVQNWLNINTDAMVVRHENAKIQPSPNAPSLDGTNLLLDDYHQEIIDGFRQMYRFLMEHRQAILAPDGPLAALADREIRFVFRPTQIYSSTFKKTLNPKFLRNGVDWSIQFDILSRAILLSDTQPFYWPLLRVEQQALEQMDIPLFNARSNSDALTIAPNQKIEKYFSEPSFNRVISRIERLNNEDLEQQMSFIRASLYSRTADNAHSFSLSDDLNCIINSIIPLKEAEITQQAIKIATELQKQAIRSKDGCATWIAPQYILKAQKFQLQPIEYSLYDGSCGVALFLATLEKVTGGAGFRELALDALQSLRQDLQELTLEQNYKEIGIGGAAGCGSIIYVLTRVSQFINEPALLEDAKQIASSLAPRIASDDNRFDIISGSAGAILGLLAFYNISADLEVLAAAISCGHHLLNNRVASNSGYKAWATLDNKLLTGFSHGAAGIAYALLRLYQVTGEAAFLVAAEEAIAYERSVFIHEQGNWPDFRESFQTEKPVCMCSWCHGAPGIGLARLAGLDILDTPEIRQDTQAAVNTTKQLKLSGIDHLCCGNLGLVEFLFAAGRKLSQPELVETAMTRATQVVARAKQRGHFGYGLSLTFHPGFFQGASGIGYQLLRLAYPDQIPSVLLWE
jgi:type 2 lantibiotic biosynthesis protein LanM